MTDASDNGTRRQKLLSDLLADTLLVVLLPLGVVILVRWALGPLGVETPSLLESGPESYFFAVLPELGFATLFVWALARRRLTDCRPQPGYRPDSVILFFVALASISLAFVLALSWTSTHLSWVIFWIQALLLAAGLVANFMITQSELQHLPERRVRHGRALERDDENGEGSAI